MFRGLLTRITDYYDAIYPPQDPELELLYFDVAGIAQSIRDTMLENGMNFTDTRLTKEQFDDLKENLPFGKLPVAYVEDETLTQSKTLLRFVSRYCKTFPSKDLVNQANCDQWLELHTEFMNPIYMSIYPSKYGLLFTEDEKMAHRTRFIIEEHIPKYFKFLNDALDVNEWICTESKSAADYCWLPTLKWLYSGTFDGVDSSTFGEFPEVLSYLKRNYDIVTEEDECTEQTQDD